MTPRQGAYRKYLQSEHWKTLRVAALIRDRHKCTKCGSGEHLNVHHETYRSPWESCTVSDLKTLCEYCHSVEHFGEITDAEFSEWEAEQAFYEAKKRIEKGLNYMSPITKEDERLLVRLAVNNECRWSAQAMFRLSACVRIGRSERWASWLKKSRDVKMALFSWSERKFDRIKSELTSPT